MFTKNFFRHSLLASVTEEDCEKQDPCPAWLTVELSQSDDLPGSCASQDLGLLNEHRGSCISFNTKRTKKLLLARMFEYYC